MAGVFDAGPAMRGSAQMGKKTWAKDLRGEDFLNLGREDEMEIERLSEILIRLEARAKRVTAVYRQSGGGKGEGPEAVWLQLAEQREKLQKRLSEAAQRQEEVEAFLERIGQGRYREMLRLRFLNFLSVEEAAARMGYSYDAGKRISAQAMRAARVIWEKDHAEG